MVEAVHKITTSNQEELSGIGYFFQKEVIVGN